MEDMFTFLSGSDRSSCGWSSGWLPAPLGPGTQTEKQTVRCFLPVKNISQRHLKAAGAGSSSSLTVPTAGGEPVV